MRSISFMRKFIFFCAAELCVSLCLLFEAGDVDPAEGEAAATRKANLPRRNGNQSDLI